MGVTQDQIAYVNGLARAPVAPATARASISNGAITWEAVDASPVVLHKQSGYDRNTYGLARMVMSEIGDSFDAWRLVPVAELTRNRARRLGCEVYQLLVGRTAKDYNYTQWQYGSGEGRFASTLQDPSTKTIKIAEMVLQRGSSFIPANAENWDQPSLQDKQFNSGRNTKDAIAIAQDWGADGYEWIGPLPGVNSYDDAVFGHVGHRVDNAALVSLIKAARAGKDITSPNSSIPAVADTNASGVPWWLLMAGTATAVIYL